MEGLGFIHTQLLGTALEALGKCGFSDLWS